MYVPQVLSIESVLQIFSPNFGSFNSQSTTVIAESFFDEIERHLLEDVKQMLGGYVEAVQYAIRHMKGFREPQADRSPPSKKRKSKSAPGIS